MVSLYVVRSSVRFLVFNFTSIGGHHLKRIFQGKFLGTQLYFIDLKTLIILIWLADIKGTSISQTNQWSRSKL